MASVKMSIIIKQPLIISLSIFINALLFLLIHQLVSNEIVSIQQFKDLNWLDFIKLEQQTVREDKTRKIIPDEPLPPEKTPELPKSIRPEIPKPERIDINVPTPAIDVPLGVTGIPYLGDYLKSIPEHTAPITDIATNLVPTRKIEPVYPPRALRAGIEGNVIAEFTINTDGSVKDVEIVNADPPDIFDRSVITAIKKWRFVPEYAGGKAIEKRARQEIKFTLQK
jgi:periplasmic protein TonB